MAELKIPSEMPAHFVDALKNGRGVIWEGGVKTLADFGGDPNAGEAGPVVDLAVENARLRDELATKGDTSLYDSFLPNSKSEIEALPLKKLKALASIKGVSVEGDDKAAYVAALSPVEPPVLDKDGK